MLSIAGAGLDFLLVLTAIAENRQDEDEYVLIIKAPNMKIIIFWLMFLASPFLSAAYVPGTCFVFPDEKGRYAGMNDGDPSKLLGQYPAGSEDACQNEVACKFPMSTAAALCQRELGPSCTTVAPDHRECPKK